MPKIKNKKLAEKIIRIAVKDTNMRVRFRKCGKWDGEVDFSNTKIMRKVVAKHGWPTIDLVGKKASQAAWLLVQHADHDLIFQKRCLALIKKVYKLNPKSVYLRNIAYLTDRVLIHMGKKQLYGTQLRIQKGGSVPLPIKDRKNLDNRRRTMNLLPFKAYQKQINKKKLRR